MKDIWAEETFRDGAPELVNGNWVESQTYTPVPENTIKAARALQKQQEAKKELDIEEFIEQVSNEEDNEEEDFAEVLSDARLRLEQGKLYEMIMNHDLFNGVDADVRAVKSVQKQIRKFAKEQMEIMLGMRQENFVSSQTNNIFSPLETKALKDIAFQLITAKNMKEENDVKEIEKEKPELPPKKKTLNSISSNSLKTKPVLNKTSIKKELAKPEPIEREKRKIPPAQYPPEFEIDYEPLSKPIHEMTAQELAERDRQALERQKNRMVITPKKERAPWPSYEEQMAMAQSQVTRVAGGMSGFSALNGSLSRLVMNSVKKS